MSLLVSVMSGRLVYSAIHSESVSKFFDMESEKRKGYQNDKRLTCSVRFAHTRSAMQEERHPGTFPLDEVCSPCWSVNSITTLVYSYEALGKCFQSSDSFLISDQAVDHLLLESWFLEVSDVKGV
jgi:hypothetical protein